ncbi:MAG: LuxR C-terminal-related transcriptional regulator [Candidatus Acidiferrales bacterium]
MRGASGTYNSLSILIAEANQMNCQLIQDSLCRGRSRITVVGATIDAVVALSLLKEREPDVAIISARLVTGPVDGFALLRNIHSLRLRTRIVVLLDSRDRELVVDAFRFGAHGVIFRDEPVRILAKCLRAVRDGQIWAGSLYLGYIVAALAKAMPLPAQNFRGADRLTRRERDIAAAIAEGLSNREASARLHLSESTVRNYLQHIFDKLGVSSRSELMLFWINRSLQTPLGLYEAGDAPNGDSPSHAAAKMEPFDAEARGRAVRRAQ